ncbi:MAG: hypothetical protein M3O32_07120 [Actinomycetota bacterium]|nr:hypothetical protein [Actinomycetota bacterium]
MTQKPLVIVVLGAGASFDCSPEWTERGWNGDWIATGGPGGQVDPASLRPPLVRNLLEDTRLNTRLFNAYSRARPLVMQLRAKMARMGSETPFALEQELAEYLDQAEGNDEAAAHLDGFRWYLYERIKASSDAVTKLDGGVGGLTNHAHMLNALHAWTTRVRGHLLVISVNYDIIAEVALADVCNFRVDDLEDFVSHQGVTLLKPHGSIDWSFAVNADRPGSVDALRRFQPLGSDAGVAVVQQDRTAPRARDEIPAIALPVRNKQGFVWPANQEAAFEKYHGYDNIRGVLSVGWNAAEEHFMTEFTRLFSWQPRAVAVVAGSESLASDVWEQRLSRAFPDGHGMTPTLGQAGFSEFCRGSELENFIQVLGDAEQQHATS